MSTRRQSPSLDTIAVIGNYLPRRCGIATFTTDLCHALASTLGGEGDVFAVAMNDLAEGYRYPEAVRFEIRAGVPGDYRLATDYLNISRADMVILQHEYGIFGGPAGSHILRTLREMHMPLMTTLHTVLENPNDEQRLVMEELVTLSDQLVVMSHRAVQMLQEIHDVPREKISMIPHGIPDVPFVDPNFYKDQFGVEGRPVILTFGLLSPGKGIEHLLQALPAIVEQTPDIAYLLLGATHPHVKQHSGEEYRHGLQKLVRSLNLQENVFFHDRFVSLEELCQYIGSADIYVTPYLGAEQIVSGTLAYSLGAGKAVVSTPYRYAEEMLADGRGRLVPFANPAALAEQINDLLANATERHAMRKRAYQYCRTMIWEEVGRSYVTTALDLLEERGSTAQPFFSRSHDANGSDELPECDLRHLHTMTDDTGIFQHAIYAIPERAHGYCTDDNARALIVATLYHRLRLDENVLPLMQTYLAFLNDAFNIDQKRFRNFMGYNREWLEEIGSEDSHGRAIWALGVTVANAPNETMLRLSARLFDDAIDTVDQFISPRSWAYALIGVHCYLERLGGDSEVRRTRERLARRVQDHFVNQATDAWPWCEETATYDNAKLAHALILSGRWVPDDAMLERGLSTLRWLLEIQTNNTGQLSVIGNNGWFSRGGERALFDQQPLEAAGLIDACAEAYRVTRDEFWIIEARKCIGWFLGHNDLNVPICDFKTGGCCDGLSPTGPNENQGAESTLAWLSGLLTLNILFEERTLFREKTVTPA